MPPNDIQASLRLELDTAAGRVETLEGVNEILQQVDVLYARIGETISSIGQHLDSANLGRLSNSISILNESMGYIAEVAATLRQFQGIEFDNQALERVGQDLSYAVNILNSTIDVQTNNLVNVRDALRRLTSLQEQISETGQGFDVLTEFIRALNRELSQANIGAIAEDLGRLSVMMVALTEVDPQQAAQRVGAAAASAAAAQRESADATEAAAQAHEHNADAIQRESEVINAALGTEVTLLDSARQRSERFSIITRRGFEDISKSAIDTTQSMAANTSQVSGFFKTLKVGFDAFNNEVENRRAGGTLFPPEAIAQVQSVDDNLGKVVSTLKLVGTSVNERAGDAIKWGSSSEAIEKLVQSINGGNVSMAAFDEALKQVERTTKGAADSSTKFADTQSRLESLKLVLKPFINDTEETRQALIALAPVFVRVFNDMADAAAKAEDSVKVEQYEALAAFFSGGALDSGAMGTFAEVLDETAQKVGLVQHQLENAKDVSNLTARATLSVAEAAREENDELFRTQRAFESTTKSAKAFVEQQRDLVDLAAVESRFKPSSLGIETDTALKDLNAYKRGAQELLRELAQFTRITDADAQALERVGISATEAKSSLAPLEQTVLTIARNIDTMITSITDFKKATAEVDNFSDRMRRVSSVIDATRQSVAGTASIEIVDSTSLKTAIDTIKGSQTELGKAAVSGQKVIDKWNELENSSNRLSGAIPQLLENVRGSYTAFNENVESVKNTIQTNDALLSQLYKLQSAEEQLAKVTDGPVTKIEKLREVIQQLEIEFENINAGINNSDRALTNYGARIREHGAIQKQYLGQLSEAYQLREQLNTSIDNAENEALAESFGRQRDELQGLIEATRASVDAEGRSIETLRRSKDAVVELKNQYKLLLELRDSLRKYGQEDSAFGGFSDLMSSITDTNPLGQIETLLRNIQQEAVNIKSAEIIDEVSARNQLKRLGDIESAATKLYDKIRDRPLFDLPSSSFETVEREYDSLERVSETLPQIIRDARVMGVAIRASFDAQKEADSLLEKMEKVRTTLSTTFNVDTIRLAFSDITAENAKDAIPALNATEKELRKVNRAAIELITSQETLAQANAAAGEATNAQADSLRTQQQSVVDTLQAIDEIRKKYQTLSEAESVFENLDSKFTEFALNLRQTSGRLRGEFDNIIPSVTNFKDVLGLLNKRIQLYEGSLNKLDKFMVNGREALSQYRAELEQVGDQNSRYAQSLRTTIEALSALVESHVDEATVMAALRGDIDAVNAARGNVSAFDATAAASRNSIELLKAERDTVKTLQDDYKSLGKVVTQLGGLKTGGSARFLTEGLTQSLKGSDIKSILSLVNTFKDVGTTLDELYSRLQNVNAGQTDTAGVVAALEEQYLNASITLEEFWTTLQRTTGAQEANTDSIRAAVAARLRQIEASTQETALNRSIAATLAYATSLQNDFIASSEGVVKTTRDKIDATMAAIRAGTAEVDQIRAVGDLLRVEQRDRNNLRTQISKHIANLEAQSQKSAEFAAANRQNIENLKTMKLAIEETNESLSGMYAEVQRANTALNASDRIFAKSETAVLSFDKALTELQYAEGRLLTDTVSTNEQMAESWKQSGKAASRTLGDIRASIRTVQGALNKIDAGAADDFLLQNEAVFRDLLAQLQAYETMTQQVVKNGKDMSASFNTTAAAAKALDEALRVMGTGGAGGTGGGGGGDIIGDTGLDKRAEGFAKQAQAQFLAAEAAKANAAEQLKLFQIERRGGRIRQENIDGLDATRKTLLRVQSNLRQLRAIIQLNSDSTGEHSEKLKGLVAGLNRAEDGMSELAAKSKYGADAFRGVAKEMETATQQIRSTIQMQLRHFTSFGLIFGTIRGIRSAFGELVETTNQLGRAATVSRSPVLDLNERMKVLGDTIDDVRQKFGKASAEIGEALYQLGSAGLTVEQQLAAIEPTMNLIVGTGADVNKVTKAIATTFNILNQQMLLTGRASQDFAHISDVIAVTYRDNQIEIEEFVNALKFTIPIAHQVGVSFENLAAILGTLHTQGIKAGLAGRQLRAMFFRMANSRKELEAAFRDLNLEIDPRQPLDFLNIIQQIGEGIRKETLSVTRLEKILKSMGIRATGAFLTLVKSVDLLNQNLNLTNNESLNVAENMAGFRLDQLASQLEIAKQNLFLLVQEGLMPLVVIITSAVKAFNFIAESISKINEIFGGFLGVVVKVVGTVLSLITIFAILRKVFITLAAAYSLIVGVTAEQVAATAASIAANSADAAAKEVNTKATVKLAAANVGLAGSAEAVSYSTLKSMSATQLLGLSFKATGAKIAAATKWVGAHGIVLLKVAAVIAAIVAIGWVAYINTTTYALEQLAESSKEAADAHQKLLVAQRELTSETSSFDKFVEQAQQYAIIQKDLLSTSNERSIAEAKLQKLLTSGLNQKWASVIEQTSAGLRLSTEMAEDYRQAIRAVADIKVRDAIEANNEAFKEQSEDLRDVIEDIGNYEKELLLAQQALESPAVRIGGLAAVNQAKDAIDDIKEEIDSLVKEGSKAILDLRIRDPKKYNEFIKSLEIIPEALRSAIFPARELKDVLDSLSVPSFDPKQLRVTFLDTALESKIIVGDLIDELDKGDQALKDFGDAASSLTGSFSDIGDRSQTFIDILAEGLEIGNANIYAEAWRGIIKTSLDAMYDELIDAGFQSGDIFMETMAAAIEDSAGIETSALVGLLDEARQELEDLNGIAIPQFIFEAPDGTRKAFAATRKEVEKMVRAQAAFAVASKIVAKEIAQINRFSSDSLTVRTEEQLVFAEQIELRKQVEQLGQLALARQAEMLKKSREINAIRKKTGEVDEQQLKDFQELVKSSEELTKLYQSRLDLLRKNVSAIHENRKSWFEIGVALKQQREEYEKTFAVGKSRGDQIKFQLEILDRDLKRERQRLSLTKARVGVGKRLATIELKHEIAKTKLLREQSIYYKEQALARHEAVRSVLEAVEVERSLLGIVADLGINYESFNLLNEEFLLTEKKRQELVDKSKKGSKEYLSTLDRQQEIMTEQLGNLARHIELLREMYEQMDLYLDLWRAFVEMQRDAAASMREIVSGRFNQQLDLFKKSLGFISGLRPFDFLIKAGRLLGTTVEDSSSAIEEMARQLETGEVTAEQLGRSFGPYVAQRAEQMRSHMEEMEMFAARELELTKRLAGKDLEILSQLLPKGDKLTFQELERVQGLMSNVVGYASDIARVDSSAAFDMYDRIAQIAKELEGVTLKKEEEIFIDIIINEDKFVEQLKRMTDDFEAFVRRMSELGGEGVTIKFGAETLEFTEKFKKTLSSLLESALGRFQPRNAGGMIEYFASGGAAQGTDTVPAMLTPGEFVLPVSVVRRIGSDLLNKLISGNLSGDDVSQLAAILYEFQSGSGDLTKSLRRNNLSFFEFLNRKEDNESTLYTQIRDFADKFGIQGFKRGGLVDMAPAGINRSTGAQTFADGGMVQQYFQEGGPVSGLSSKLTVDVALSKELEFLFDGDPVLVLVEPELGPSSIEYLRRDLQDAAYGADIFGNRKFQQKTERELKDSTVKPFIDQFIIIRKLWLAQVQMMVDQSRPLFSRMGYVAAEAFNAAFSGAIGELFSAVGGVLGTIVSTDWIPDSAVSEATDKLKDLKDSYDDSLESLVKSLRRNEISYFEYLNRLEDLNAKHKKDIESAKEEGSDVDDLLGDRVAAIIEAIQTGFSSVVSSFADTLLSSIVDLLATASSNFFNDVFRNIRGGVQDVFKLIGGEGFESTKIGEWFKDAAIAYNGLNDSLNALKDSGIGDVFTSIGDLLWTSAQEVGNVLGSVGEFVGNVFESIGESIGSMIFPIVDYLDSGLSALSDVLSSAGSSIGDFFSSAGSSAGDFFSDIFGSIGSVFGDLEPSSVFEDLNTIDFGSVVTVVGDALNDAGSWIVDNVPIISGAIQGIGDAFDGVRDMVGDWFDNIGDSFDKVGDSFDKVGEVVGSAGKNIGKSFDGVKNAFDGVDWGGLWGGLTDGLGIAGNVFGGLTSAVTGAIGAIVGMGSVMFSIGATLASLQLEDVQSFFFGDSDNKKSDEQGYIPDIFEQIDGLVTHFATEMPKVIDVLVENAPKMIDKLLEGIPKIIKNIADKLPDLIQLIIRELPKIVKGLGSMLGQVFQMLIDNLPDLGKIIGDAIAGIIDIIADEIIPRLPQFISSLFKSLINIIKKVLPAIGRLIASLLKNLGPIITELIGGVLDAVFAIVEEIPGILTSIIEALPAMLEGFAESLPGLIERLAESIPALLNKLGAALPGLVWALVKAIPGIILAIFKGIWNSFKSAFTKLPSILLNGLKDGISKVFEPIQKIFDGILTVFNKIKSFFEGIGSKAKDAGNWVADRWEGLKTRARNTWNRVRGWFRHDGGIINQGDTTVLNQVTNQTSLKPDETLRILQFGEGVLQRSAMDALGPERFHMINQGMSLEDIIIKNSGRIVDLSNPISMNSDNRNISSGLPTASTTNVYEDNRTNTYQEGDYNEGDFGISFHNCTFTSDEVANNVERKLVEKFHNRSGELQKILRNNVDNKTKRLR